MAELVDALALEASAFGRVGSSPTMVTECPRGENGRRVELKTPFFGVQVRVLPGIHKESCQSGLSWWVANLPGVEAPEVRIFYSPLTYQR